MSKKEEEKIEDDFVVEPEEEISGFSSPAQKKLREKLKKAVEEKQEYLDGWQRAKADLVNAKREFEDERKKIIGRANEDMIMELLPVFDSFDMAFKNKEVWEAVDANWRTGVEYIHNQLHSIMREYGVSRIEAEGKKFDPRFHISVETKNTEDEAKDDIIERVVHNGYMKGEVVLRPAQVVVFEFKSE
ncbi:nucleotide exchange factor GrpE [Candidatus Campbellbacteria bacterium CG22_combo_CG10-13_8_21_14_all_36_13]|uniref:Protein GrpE n=1 Tax=Candidatus Campbellbacteria bacterium CG22_combo_CG10-13_8_21_14_all_36_13 TaxID=1974529 RepID=A0A2H0DZ93_9BACT|nr:MAG: nucleotide exchange factor GrpE [Candidatus Campbellbacteria bacterium CG22_combo_CG10-13_8_21_14_all_36_13]